MATLLPLPPGVFVSNPLTRTSISQGKFYVSSMSSQTVTYKGQLTPAQVLAYYKDLQRDDFVTHMALVRQSDWRHRRRGL